MCWAYLFVEFMCEMEEADLGDVAYEKQREAEFVMYIRTSTASLHQAIILPRSVLVHETCLSLSQHQPAYRKCSSTNPHPHPIWISQSPMHSYTPCPTPNTRPQNQLSSLSLSLSPSPTCSLVNLLLTLSDIILPLD